ncbi:site-specific integrase [Photorhabdus heterorhabditis]|uniref:site-specific integrase n=1 Tax=Photorhabdus heterorhabditis TaxID=880156 RepID=UPI001BD2C6F0|nr:site-specific integrase [Photorhabdus heterorhabditis]
MGNNQFVENLQNKIMYTKDKIYSFDIYLNTWVIGKGIILNFNLINLYLPEKFKPIFRNVMAIFAQNYSAFYAKRMFWSAYDFFKRVNRQCSEEITNVDLRNYYILTYNDNYTYVESIKYFFRKWHELGYLGISQLTYNFLLTWRIKKKNVGQTVRTFDPEGGPLTDKELQDLHKKSLEGYKDRKINTFDFSLLNILLCTGRRPLQIAHLKNSDLKDSNGNFFLKIPRVKQNGIFRQEFKSVEIPNGLYQIILLLINENIEKVELVCSYCLTDKQKKSLPIFPEFLNLKSRKLYLQKDIYDDDFLHVHSDKISRRLKSISKTIGVISHRTNRVLILNARRLRYTIGTRAAREGCDASVIADLLDHSSTKTVQTYIKNVPENAKKIDDVLSELLIPYAQSFYREGAFGSIHWLDNVIFKMEVVFEKIKENISIDDEDTLFLLHDALMLIKKYRRADCIK